MALPPAVVWTLPFRTVRGSDHLDSMSGNLHNPRVATGKLVALGNQKRWVEAIQLLGVHHLEKSRLNLRMNIGIG